VNGSNNFDAAPSNSLTVLVPKLKKYSNVMKQSDSSHFTLRRWGAQDGSLLALKENPTDPDLLIAV
jgi:hypothetical protein